MNQFLLGCALGFAFIACIAVPFVAPWRIRVRYLVNAQVADPVFGVGPPPDVILREVNVTRVDATQGHVDLVVEEAGAAPEWRRRSLAREACPPAMVAKLDGWSTAHEPLLMVVDEGGETHLYGPDGAITNLSWVQERTP